MNKKKTTETLLLLTLLCASLYLLRSKYAPSYFQVDKKINLNFITHNDERLIRSSVLLSGVTWPSFFPECVLHGFQEKLPQFTAEERGNVSKCIKEFDKLSSIGNGKFWSGNNPSIRTNFHSYLNNRSIIIDIGGNVGEDAQNFLKYQPKAYLMFEPLTVLYEKLVTKFQNFTQVYVYNFGFSKKDQVFEVDYKGNIGDATSMFQKSTSNKTKMSLKTYNATNVFLGMRVQCIEPDLITINCEGCEFEVMENILHTGIAKFFKNIQFATHVRIAEIPNLKKRYCEIQALLERTHRIGYHYFGCWESWIRRI